MNEVYYKIDQSSGSVVYLMSVALIDTQQKESPHGHLIDMWSLPHDDTC